MASLLSWAGNAVKRVANTVNNDVVRPIQRDVVAPATHVAQAAVAQANPLDGGRTYNTVMQRGAQYAPQPQQSAVHQVTHNGLTNATGSLLNNVTGIPSAIDSARLGIAELTHNQPAIDNATTSLAKNLPRFLPIGMATSFKNGFGQDIATAAAAKLGENTASKQSAYAQKMLNNHTGDKVHDSAVNAYASGVKTDLLNSSLGSAGVDMNTPTSQVVKHVAGNAANTAANVVLAGKLPGTVAAKGALLKPALTYGGINAAAGVAQTMADPNATAMDYLKNGAVGFATGAALPVAGRAAGKAAPLVAKGAQKLTQENPAVAELQSQKAAAIEAMDTAKPTMMKNLVANVNSLDSQIKAIKEGGFAKVPGKKPTEPVQPIAKTYQTVHQGGIIKPVQGEPVPLVKGVDTFIHKGTGGYVVSEASTGRHIGSGTTKELAVTSAKTNIGSVGEPQFKQMIAQNKLSATQTSRAPATTTPPKLQPATGKPLAKPAIGQATVSLKPAKGEPAVSLPTAKSSTLPAESQTPQTIKPELPSTSTADSTPVAPGVNQRGFTTSVKQSANYSKDLKKAVNNTYDPYTDKQAIANTQKLINDKGIEAAHQGVLQRLQGAGKKDKQLATDAGTVMQILDSQGRTAEAQQVHNLLDEHFTNSGQFSQAAGLLLRRSPDGIYHKAVSDLQKAGVEVTTNIDKQLQAHREAIRATMPDSQERNIAIQQLKQFVSKNIPTSFKDKAYAVWRAGLLTGPRTVAKIITSHGVHAPLEALKNIPGSAIDATLGRGISRLANGQGQRALVMTTQGVGRGAVKGAKAGVQLMRTGIDENPGSNAIEFRQNANFGTKLPGRIVQAYVDGIGHLHGSLYKPFYGAAHLNSLYSQALAAAKTAGLKGSDANGFVENFVKNPSHEAMDIANNDAAHTTFQQETALGKLASSLQQHGGILGKVVAPFTRIPSAIATDLIDYSPVGAVKTILSGIKDARSGGWTVAAQRNFSQGLGRSIVGTAAIVPGVVLYQKGLMTLEYPTNPADQKLWAQEGKTANSVLVGGKWRSLGSLGPVGSVLAIGGHMGESLGQGDDIGQAALKGLGGGLTSITNQSYLSGLTNATDALKQPGRYLNNIEKSYAGSIVPTFLSQLASAGDKSSRQVNTPGQSIQSKVPFARERLPAKFDQNGNTIPNGESGVGALVDPFYSSTNRPGSTLQQEQQRLQDTKPAGQSGQTSFNGVKTDLGKSGQQKLNAIIGKGASTVETQLVKAQAYKNLSDDQKRQVIANVHSDVTAAYKDQYAQQNNLGQYAPNFNGKSSKLTIKQQNILDGKFDPNAYIDPSAGGTKGTTSSSVKLANGTAGPKVPKAPRSTTTTYDPATKTWTQTNSKTGRVTRIDANGTRTVVKAGTSTHSHVKGSKAKTKTTSLASYLSTVKSTTGNKIKAPSAPNIRVGSSNVPKFKSVSLKQYRLQKHKIA